MKKELELTPPLTNPPDKNQESMHNQDNEHSPKEQWQLGDEEEEREILLNPLQAGKYTYGP